MGKKDSVKEATKTVSLPKGAQYHCDYCRKDISNTIRIKCAVCQDFDLCVECFSVGVEMQQHKNDHAYHVIDQLNFPVFTEDWLASDELLLLEGIEMYGIGNWEDIAEHVATKTNKQCEEHYFTTYIDVPSCPKPNMNVKFTQDQILAATQQKNTALSKPVRRAKPMPSHPVNHELSGFMPKRGEFEIEYDNDIEYVLTDMCFNEDDTPTERELKLSVLHIYNQRVKYREEVRKFVIDHNILDLKKHQMNDRERTPDQKKIYHKSKKLLQIISEEEHQEFINDLILEKELRNKLATLCNYRKNGIRTMSDAKLFDSDRKETRSRKDARSRLRDKDIETDTSFDLLSTAERELCESISIPASQYMLIKETLIREYIRIGSIQKSAARSLFKLEAHKFTKIYDYFEECGWINNLNHNSDLFKQNQYS